jgi:hypothetical protein
MLKHTGVRVAMIVTALAAIPLAAVMIAAAPAEARMFVCVSCTGASECGLDGHKAIIFSGTAQFEDPDGAHTNCLSPSYAGCGSETLHPNGCSGFASIKVEKEVATALMDPSGAALVELARKYGKQVTYNAERNALQLIPECAQGEVAGHYPVTASQAARLSQVAADN